MTAHPEVLVQLRDELVADAEGFNVHRRQHKNIRFGEDGKVRRSHQAVACRKRYAEKLGRPYRLLPREKMEAGYAAIEAQKGKPGYRTMLKPKHPDGTLSQAGGGVL